MNENITLETDDAWPTDLMCRLLLPVPVKELAAIGNALAKIARKQGKEARIKQVGRTLEIFTVQNAQVDLPDTAAQDSASKSNNPAVSG